MLIVFKKKCIDVTANQLQFLTVLRQYSGIADNCNLMAETGWTKRQVVAVGSGLVKKKLVTYKLVEHVGFEGGIWEVV